MATIAVGDVHGNLAALDDLLGQLRTVTSEGDVVVFLGDYIDRGPESKACVDAILALKHDVAAEVVCLRGNHEDWLLRTQRDYHHHSWLLGMEAFDTIRSYSLEAAQTLRDAVSNAGTSLYVGHCALPYEAFFDCVPKAHVEFFESLRWFYQGPDCVCTHGGVDPGVAGIDNQPSEALIWGVSGFPNRYRWARHGGIRPLEQRRLECRRLAVTQDRGPHHRNRHNRIRCADRNSNARSAGVPECSTRGRVSSGVERGFQ